MAARHGGSGASLCRQAETGYYCPQGGWEGIDQPHMSGSNTERNLPTLVPVCQGLSDCYQPTNLRPIPQHLQALPALKEQLLDGMEGRTDFAQLSCLCSRPRGVPRTIKLHTCPLTSALPANTCRRCLPSRSGYWTAWRGAPTMRCSAASTTGPWS